MYERTPAMTTIPRTTILVRRSKVSTSSAAAASASGGTMMSSPERVGAFVDGAERIAARGRLARLPSEERRRLLAWAVFETLRHDSDGAWRPEPVPVPS